MYDRDALVGLPREAYTAAMHCLDPLHPLFNAILEAVAAKPGITMGELHAVLKKNKNADANVSLQHLYRVVTRMIDEQILLKLKGKLSLNLMWISYVEFFAQRAQKNTLEMLAKDEMFPLKDGQRRSFTAESLTSVETIWNHLLVQLYRVTQEKNLYKYNSHAWMQLGKHTIDRQFYEQLSARGIVCRWLFGNDTPLDRYGIAQNNPVFPSVIAPNPPFPTEGYSLTVYGEYMIECFLPENVASHLGKLFASAKDEKTFDRQVLLDLFSLKAKYKVTVWRNAEQAEILKKKMGFYFDAPKTAKA